MDSRQQAALAELQRRRATQQVDTNLPDSLGATLETVPPQAMQALPPDLIEGGFIAMPAKPPAQISSDERKASAIAELERRKAQKEKPFFDVGASVSAIPQALVDVIPGGRKAAGALGALGARAFGVEAPLQVGVNDAMMQREQAIKNAPIAYYSTLLGTGLLGGGALAGTKAARALGSLGSRGGLAGRAATGGLAGEATQRVYEAGEAELGKEGQALVREGVSLGGILGAAFPVVGTAAGAAGRALTPKIDDALKPVVQKAKDLGIPLRADQVADSKIGRTVQKISQAIPFSGTDAFEDLQRKQFTKQAAKTIGLDTDILSPDSIKAFKEANRGAFRRGLGDKPISLSKDDITNLSSVKNTISETLGLNARDARILNTEVDRILDSLTTDTISPEKLASIRSAVIDKGAKAGSGSPVYSDLVSKIDEIAERVGDPSVIKEARRHYRNYKTLEPLITESETGVINPTRLLQRVRSSKFIDSADKAIGEDELVDLARVGQLLRKQGGSDTFEKTTLFGGGVLGGALDPVTTMAVAPAIMGANRALQAGLLRNQGSVLGSLQQPQSMLRLPNNRSLGAGVLSGAGAAQLQ